MRTLLALRDVLRWLAGLAYLGIMCFGWCVLALLLYPCLSARGGTALGRRVIMKGFRSYACFLHAVGVYQLDLHEIDVLKDGPPLILAPNHPSLIDAVFVLSGHPNLTCVMKAELMRSPFLGAGARLARYIETTSPRALIRSAIVELKNGSSLLLFPEGTRTVHPPLNPLKASVAVIAKHAQVPIQTLLIETDSSYLGKGWPIWHKPSLPIRYRIRLGRRFEPPEDVDAFMQDLERCYARELSSPVRAPAPAPVDLAGLATRD
jgi:1-acyl-sn-glycerol-3-phosphate acyltransferase